MKKGITNKPNLKEILKKVKIGNSLTKVNFQQAKPLSLAEYKDDYRVAKRK